jgi:hypothetical protein
VQREDIELTLSDIYFMTSLPMYGVVGDILPVMPRGRTLDEFLERNYGQDAEIHDGVIKITNITSLETRAIAAAVVQIMGSHGPHRVSSGQIMTVERVLECTYFGWAQMLLTTMRRQLYACKRASGGNFAFGTLLCAFFFEKIPTLWPHAAIRAAGPREP